MAKTQMGYFSTLLYCKFNEVLKFM